MVMSRSKYRVYRNHVVGCIMFVQVFWRMHHVKKKFKITNVLKKNASANFVQRYLKGYKVHKEYKEIIHRDKIDSLMTHFRAMRILMQTTAQIKIRYYWKKYKIRKAKRLADALKKKESNNKRFGKAPVAKPMKRPGGSGVSIIKPNKKSTTSSISKPTPKKSTISEDPSSKEDGPVKADNEKNQASNVIEIS